MIWKTSPPTEAPSERYIPVGSIFVRQADTDETVAIVVPQRLTGETQRLAGIVARAPDVLRAVRNLDIAAQAKPQNDINMANAWRELRRAIAGLEEPTP